MPNKTVQHLSENKVVYALLAILTGAGGTATLTNNLPVTQGEFQAQVVAYDEKFEELDDIKGKVDELLLGQLRARLRQAYKDRCLATDQQAIEYIDNEIEELQDEYVDLTGSRFPQPPCIGGTS